MFSMAESVIGFLIRMCHLDSRVPGFGGRKEVLFATEAGVNHTRSFFWQGSVDRSRV